MNSSSPSSSPSSSSEVHIPPAPAVDDGFDAFWQSYPKKVGKGDAAKAWRIVHPSADLRLTIHAAIATQRTCRQWLKDGGQFIPNPGTWLRQKRWDDEPDQDGFASPTRTVATPMPAYDADWCQHEPRCNSRAWHEVVVEREKRAVT